MRISRLEPMATSKRVRKAAPLRQTFSLAVSSSKAKPRESRPRTRRGRRTEILRSDLFLAMLSLMWLMGWALPIGRSLRKEALHGFDHFPWSARRIHDAA